MGWQRAGHNLATTEQQQHKVFNCWQFNTNIPHPLHQREQTDASMKTCRLRTKRLSRESERSGFTSERKYQWSQGDPFVSGLRF